MELKEGYRITELGLIPEDWNIKTISEISTPVRGGSPRPAGDPKYFNGNYIPWLTVAALTNIPASQIYVFETETYLTEHGSLYSRILEKGTLIIANSGATLGIAKILGLKCCANDGIAALLHFDNSISKDYLIHFINSKTRFLREVVATGNGQPNLNTSLIGLINIPLPPTLHEQTAIATALSDMDALIAQTEKLIEKKKAIKQGVMQRLLSPRGEDGEMKGGWVKKRLGEVLEYEQPTKYIVKSTEYSDDYSYPVLTAGKSFILGFTNEEFGLFYNRPVIIFDDFTTASKYVDFTFKIKSSAVKILKLRDKNQANLAFMFEILQQIKYKVSDHKRHWIGEFQNIEVPLPDKQTQETIGNIIQDLQQEIRIFGSKLDKLRLQKQGMMQSLLTGKIRIYRPQHEPAATIGA